MNLSNKLTVARVVLTLGFIYFMVRPDLGAAVLSLVLFVLASATDFLDGYYARKFGWVTDFGKIMDPLADKFLILAAFYLFVRLGLVPLWMFWAILIREVVVSGYRFVAMRRNRVLAAEKAGKYKTTLQIVTIIVLLVFLIWERLHLFPVTGIVWAYMIAGLLWLTVGLTLFSGVSYLWNNRNLKAAS